MKKFLLTIFAFAISILFANAAFSENFYIQNYDVNMQVSENRVVHINETIDVFFTNPSHGIYRTIPTSYNLAYPDGTTRKAKAKISNLNASEVVSRGFSNDSKMIQMGNAKRRITGEHRYTISYDYKFDSSKYKDIEEFYYNIIGTEWPVEIKKVTFSVNMPKEFDENKVGLSIGKYGQAGFDGGANFYINGNNISGIVDRTLEPYEGVTLRVELDNGYFINSSNNTDNQSYNTYVGMGALTLVCFLIWLIFGKDDKAISVVNFYPPKGLNSAEIGTIYSDGKADNKEIVSLIIYLASKGYLAIEDKMYTITLKKLKDYTGKNLVERELMNSLFKDRDPVSEEDLRRNAYFSGVATSLEADLSKRIKDKIFDKNACTPGKVLLLLGCIIGLLFLTIYSLGGFTWEYLNFLCRDGNFILLVFPMVSIIILGFAFSLPSNSTKVFLIAFSIFFGMPQIIQMFVISMSEFEPDVKSVLAGIICLIVSLICLINLPKRNRQGNQILGEIMGFKKFIEVAEEGRIKQLINENPTYFYDIIPFAYVLGVSDKWINQFEGLVAEPPSWYSGKEHSRINPRSFNRLTKSLTSVSTPPHSSSSGGGYGYSGGGGGFSGGGHGGGGGGSW